MAGAIIDPLDLVEFFQPKYDGYIRIPQFDGIPESAVCTDVDYNDQVQSFVFRFYHDSFPKVEHGEAMPIKFTEHRILEFLLETPDDNKTADTELPESSEHGD